MSITLSVTVGVEGKDNASKAFASAEGHASSLAQKITALSTAYIAFGKAALEHMIEPLKAAMENEVANQKLANSLQVVGQYSGDALKHMTDYAHQLEEASGVHEELIKNVESTNLQLGLTAHQAEAMTQAALGLSKATGQDLTSANQQLIASLSGQSRELGRIIPEIGSMTEAQLRSGKAIDLIAARYNKFITSDLNTTEGVLKRVSNAFEDAFKQIAGAFLEGAAAGERWGTIKEALDGFIDSIQANLPRFKQLGALFGDMAVKGVKWLADNMKLLADAGNGVFWVFGKIGQTFKIIADVIAQTAEEIAILIRGLQFLGTATAAITGGDFKALGPMFKEFKDDMSGMADAAEEGRKELADHIKDLLGIGAAAEKAGDQIDKAKKKARGHGAGSPEAPPPSMQMGPVKHDLTRQEKEMQDAARAQLRDMATGLNPDTDQVLAQYQQQLNKIGDARKIAADKGYDVAKEADEAEFQAYLSMVQKKRDETLADATFTAENAGNTTDAIEAAYEQQLNDFQKMLDQKRISQEQYDAMEAEARRKADNSRIMTTGSASWDETLNKSESVMNSIQGGVNSVVGVIGSMTGPIGSIIASAIQFLNQTPAQFHNMIAGLIQGIEKLPETIVQNIPQVLEAIPQMIAAIFGQQFSIPFWESVLKNLYQGLVGMFKNFWAEIFGGKLTDSMQQFQQVQQFKGFGNDNPDAGDGKFKIQDLNLENQRRAGAFQDTFKQTVDTSGKSLVDMLKAAWQNIINMLDKWFDGLPEKIWSGLEAAAATIGNWGTEIWNGIVHAVGEIGTTFGKWGKAIWDGLMGVFSGSSWGSLGGNISDGLFNAISGGYPLLKNAGNMIWQGVRDLINADLEWIKIVGNRIWAGAEGSIQYDFNWMTNVGIYIWKGFSDSLTSSLKWLTDNFRNVFSNAISGLVPGGGGGGGVLQAIGLSKGGTVSASWANPGLAAAFSAMGALHFAEGGDVPGAGFADTVPALLRPNERVLTPEQQREQQSTTINVTFSVAAGANFDRDAVNKAMPQIVDNLKRLSKNGTIVVRSNGVL